MRRKSMKCLFDNLFWYTLYMLPILLLIINWLCSGTPSFASVFSYARLDIVSNNVIFTALVDLFGADSQIMPIFSNNDVLMYLSYFILLMILHIIVDVLLFIPRYCHKILNGDEKYDELWK